VIYSLLIYVEVGQTFFFGLEMLCCRRIEVQHISLTSGFCFMLGCWSCILLLDLFNQLNVAFCGMPCKVEPCCLVILQSVDLETLRS
jgi:hypothetical protein